MTGDEAGEQDLGDELTDLVEECLVQIESGGALDSQYLRGKAGELWEELQACLEVVLDLETVKVILDDSSPVEPLPERVGRFHVLRLLGRGGFSRVFLGFDPDLKRTVAIKVLKEHRRGSGKVNDWIVREANSLAQIEHPGVLRVHELGQFEGHQFVVTEHVPGPSLGRMLEVLRAESVDQSDDCDDDVPNFREVSTATALRPCRTRVAAILQVARALETCHAAGVIHRDVKPDNILLPSVGQPKLIDFGLSHLVSHPESLGVTEGLIGTERYLAPEQRREGRTGASEQSDVYSLGVVLYELLSLQHPLGSIHPGGERSRVAEPIAPLRKVDGALPPELEWITERALESNPGDRYATMTAFAADLEAYMTHRRPLAGPRSMLSALRRALKRHSQRVRIGLATIAGAGLLVVGGGVVLEALDRDRVAGTLEAVRGSIPSVSTPPEVTRLLDELDSAETLAVAVEGRWSARIVATSLKEDAASLRRDLAVRAESLVATATEEAMPQIRNILRLAGCQRVYDEWNVPLMRATTPGRRDRCRTSVTGLAELYLVDHDGQLDQISVGEPGEPVDLVPGAYRAVAHGNRMTEFLVLPRQLSLRVTVNKLDEVIRSSMVMVEPKGTHRNDAHGGDGPTGFLLSEHDLSLREIALSFGGELPGEIVRVLQIGGAPLSMDSLGGLMWDYARAAAAAGGARLPTPGELLEAQRQGLLSPVEGGAKEWPCYWCATVDAWDIDRHFLYELRPGIPTSAQLNGLEVHPGSSRIIKSTVGRLSPMTRIRFVR